MRRNFSLITLGLSMTVPASLTAAEVVSLGASSYLRGLPEGAKGPPATIHAAAELRGKPMPTSDWWSSLAWVDFSEAMYPHPLAVKAEASGLRVSYPGPNIHANESAIFGFMGGAGDDLTLGHSTAAKFDETRVAGWSDWFVTAEMGTRETGLRLTFGHGSPFVYARYTGGEPVLTFAKPPAIWAGQKDDAALGIRIGNRVYGLFAPAGSTWEGFGTTRLQAHTGGKDYFSLAVLPDDTPASLALFARHAHAHVTNSLVTWSYDEPSSAVETTFTLATKAMEGTETNTLFALYPHQTRVARADFVTGVYASVRGPMKLARGGSFTTSMKLPAALPSLPLPPGIDRADVKQRIDADFAGKPQLTGDTYWLGKQLGKWATMLPLCEQTGEMAAAAECDRRMRAALESFFTATDAEGKAKRPAAGVFAYEPAWGTLIGYPASFGSDDQLNDHHFHYGYFLRAAGELARRDPEWAHRWAGMLDLLARDVASPDRNDPLFPFLRCFDPYAGHSWASGHAKFGDGNNNESSSEAVNAWFGYLLLGEATGNRALRDLGAWLYTTEIAAIEDYWFDVRDELHPPAFTPSVVTMVWGGKGANGTWFTANPEAVHGINFLPITGGSLYLGRWPEYVRKNYAAMREENFVQASDAARKKNLPAPASAAATPLDQWADILWMYRALSDPSDAWHLWKARPPDFKPEAGNSLTATGGWIESLNTFGTLDRNVSADAPFAATFVRTGKATHIAWNLGTTARTVTFSDGAKIDCPAHGFASDYKP